jgi:hypothetical protein
MAFTQFPKRLVVRELDTSETMLMGGYKPGSSLSLAKAVLSVYKHGTAVGSEGLRLKVFGSESTAATPIATSDYSAIASIPGISTYWLGNLTFTFSTRVNLDADNTYWFALEAQNYTNTGAFYLSYVFDWPYPISTQLSAPDSYGAALRLLGY